MSSKADIQKVYGELQPGLEKLGGLIFEEIQKRIRELDITSIDLSYRVKSLESFTEKIVRKQVSDPLHEIHDILGFRVICFTLDDVQRTESLILDEFKVFQAVSKTDILEYDKFGYRSNHYNFIITEEMAKMAGKPEIEGLFAEFQVRTILMHTWSKIHRQLEYKKKEHIPFSLRRKLYQLSALLEIADDHLQALSDERIQLQELLKDKSIEEARNIGVDTSLNLDSLKAFIEFQYPERNVTQRGVVKLLDELLSLNLTLGTLISAYDRIEPIRKDIEDIAQSSKYSVVKLFKLSLMCGNDNYWDYKKRDKKDATGIVPELRLKLMA